MDPRRFFAKKETVFLAFSRLWKRRFSDNKCVVQLSAFFYLKIRSPVQCSALTTYGHRWTHAEFFAKKRQDFRVFGNSLFSAFLATAISLTTNMCTPNSSTFSVFSFGCSFLGVSKRWSLRGGHLRQTERKLQTKLEGYHTTNLCFQ